MELIKEPKGVDFVIKSKHLTKEEEKMISEYIMKRKFEIKKNDKRILATCDRCPGHLQ